MGAIITYDARMNSLAVNGSARSNRDSSVDAAPTPKAAPRPDQDERSRFFAATASYPSTGGAYVYYPYYGSYGSPVGGWNGVTLIAPAAGNGFGTICAPSVIYHVGFQHFYPINPCIGTFGISGLYLTGDPLHPIGQFGPAGI